MNGDDEQNPTFLARFTFTQIAVAGMIGAVILVVLVVAATSVT